MMWGYGVGAWWMWIPGLLLMLLVVAGIVVLIVLAVRSTDSSMHGRRGPGDFETDHARQALEDRLVRGEITPDQFRELLRTLQEGRSR